MSAQIYILPIIRIEHHTLDALEQRDREFIGHLDARTARPARTRPLLAVNNINRGKKQKSKTRKEQNFNGR